MINLEKQQKIFQEWIMENWKEEFHNFSKKPNGDYWYYQMQDAWEVWQGALNINYD
jgi:hypothetical protein